MIEKFNNIFYLIVFLIHFAAYGVYAFKSVIGTKSFIKQYGMDVTSAGIVRFFGGFFIGSLLMALYILLLRDNGVQASWAFFNLVFVQNFVLFFIGIYNHLLSPKNYCFYTYLLTYYSMDLRFLQVFFLLNPMYYLHLLTNLLCLR